MADEEEKTQEPTPKKIEDAKKEGNVNKSMEVTGAVILFFSSLYLIFFSNYFWIKIKKMMMYIYGFIGQDLDSNVYYTITYTIVVTLLYTLVPLFILIILLAFITNWGQFGFILTPLKFDLQKIDPIKGLGNIFGFKKVIESLKLTIKLTIIVAVMVFVILLTGDKILGIMSMSLNAAIKEIINLTIYYLLAILLIIIIFAIIDFYFTKFYYLKSLRMRKQDIKDELKNIDGDPLVKAHIRKVQMEMSMKRMMADVPTADVVITNPTHYAVALKYDDSLDKAPKMVAKGIDFMALRIKEIAQDEKIPIIENPVLARSLYNQIEVSQEIPEEFYKAIAEIFAYVFDLKKKKR